MFECPTGGSCTPLSCAVCWISHWGCPNTGTCLLMMHFQQPPPCTTLINQAMVGSALLVQGLAYQVVPGVS
jgi:hypothetical protein